MDSKQKFGRHIKKLRVQMGLSQDELAFRCGLTTPMICYIEKGERAASIDTLEKLALGFGTTLSDLFRYEDANIPIHDEDTNRILSIVLGMNPTDRKRAYMILKALIWENDASTEK